MRWGKRRRRKKKERERKKSNKRNSVKKVERGSKAIWVEQWGEKQTIRSALEIFIQWQLFKSF